MFPRKTLDGLMAPAHVRVQGVVVSPDECVSPLSGLAGAAIRVTLLAERLVGSGTYYGGRSARHETLARLWFGESLHVDVEGRSLRVPLQNLALEAAYDEEDMTPFSSGVPQELHDLVQSLPANKGTLGYREYVVNKGDTVTVKGVVAPLASASPYRASAADSAEFGLDGTAAQAWLEC